MSRDLTNNELSILQLLVSYLDPVTYEILQKQISKMEVSGGTHTMLELTCDQSTPLHRAEPGPLPVKAIVNDSNNEPIGEILLWTTDGYLSQLEYAWFTDEMPTTLPEPSQLAIET